MLLDELAHETERNKVISNSNFIVDSIFSEPNNHDLFFYDVNQSV